MKSLLKSISDRIANEIGNRDKIAFLKNLDIEVCLEILVSTVYLYSRPRKSEENRIVFSVIASAVGHNLRGEYKLKKDSSMAVKAGAFLLYSLEELGITYLEKKRGANNHANYFLTVLDEDAIKNLWASLPRHTVSKMPSETPHAEWKGPIHESGAHLIKTGNKEILAGVSVEKTPMVFECVNRMQRTAWRIVEEIYLIQKWALKIKAPVFDSIWKISNAESKASKLREVKTVFQIASKFINKEFYHMYYMDFRSRIYPSTAYLHEQGTDVSKGLLRRVVKKPMTRAGFYWLMIHLANCWAGVVEGQPVKTDKLSLDDRYRWALGNENAFIDFAERPKENKIWMGADAPWQFLSACFELMTLRKWQYDEWLSAGQPGSLDVCFNNFDFPSDLVVYIDGTTNGLQHLTALTRDDATAGFVNLLPQATPGDLYNYIGAQIWTSLEKETAHLSEEFRNKCNEFIVNLTELKKSVQTTAPKSSEREVVLKSLSTFKLANSDIMNFSAPLFWLKITKPSDRRKIVKRNVMTIPYGGSAYGLGQQVIDDARKHGIDLLFYLEHRWGAYLGRYVFEGCKLHLKRPMQLLSIFESAGAAAEKRGEFLKWTTPFVNFPVVQYYVEGLPKKVWVQYGPKIGEILNTDHYENTLQLEVCFIENTVMSKGKQSQGAAPNIIHSLDATHLIMTVNSVNFDVTTVHDSYGALLSDMPELYVAVRAAFYELYKTNPLPKILEDIQCETEVEMGGLDISLVLDSEFCFC